MKIKDAKTKTTIKSSWLQRKYIETHLLQAFPKYSHAHTYTLYDVYKRKEEAEPPLYK